MIDSIGNNPVAGLPQKKSAISAGQEISQTFGKIFDEVNQAQLDADAKIAELTTGKNKDIHGTMIAMEKASVSFRMLMAVREKMVSSYQEIMRMQV